MSGADDIGGDDAKQKKVSDFNGDQLAGIALTSIFDGNLMPLAELLKSDHPLDRGLRALIAECILSGNYSGYKMVLKGTSKNKRPRSERIAKFKKQITIGRDFEVRLEKSNSGDFEAVTLNIMDAWGVGRSSAISALSFVRGFRLGKYRAPTGAARLWAEFAISGSFDPAEFADKN